MRKMDAEASLLSTSLSVSERLKGLAFDKFVQDSWMGWRVFVIGTTRG